MGGHQAQREKKPIDLRVEDADGRRGLSRVFCIDQAGTFVCWIELRAAPTERGYVLVQRAHNPEATQAEAVVKGSN